jgi:hypothetical protein
LHCVGMYIHPPCASSTATPLVLLPLVLPLLLLVLLLLLLADLPVTLTPILHLPRLMLRRRVEPARVGLEGAKWQDVVLQDQKSGVMMTTRRLEAIPSSRLEKKESAWTCTDYGKAAAVASGAWMGRRRNGGRETLLRGEERGRVDARRGWSESTWRGGQVLAWPGYPPSVGMLSVPSVLPWGGACGEVELDLRSTRLWPRIYHANHKGERRQRASHSACVLPCLCLYCVRKKWRRQRRVRVRVRFTFSLILLLPYLHPTHAPDDSIDSNIIPPASCRPPPPFPSAMAAAPPASSLPSQAEQADQQQRQAATPSGPACLPGPRLVALLPAVDLERAFHTLAGRICSLAPGERHALRCMQWMSLARGHGDRGGSISLFPRRPRAGRRGVTFSCRLW